MQSIDAIVKKQIAKQGHGMCNRIEVSKDQALELFGYNKFKVRPPAPQGVRVIEVCARTDGGDLGWRC